MILRKNKESYLLKLNKTKQFYCPCGSKEYIYTNYNGAYCTCKKCEKESMIVNLNSLTHSIMAEETKTRYSDEELAEFKTIIVDMLAKAKAEYNTLREVVMHGGTNDIEDTSPSFKTVEDDGANQLSKEEASQLAQRQYKFIQNLEGALARIENKTYGICRVTGKLIPKERLRLVPHATLTVEAKEMLAKQGKH